MRALLFLLRHLHRCLCFLWVHISARPSEENAAAEKYFWAGRGRCEGLWRETPAERCSAASGLMVKTEHMAQKIRPPVFLFILPPVRCRQFKESRSVFGDQKDEACWYLGINCPLSLNPLPLHASVISAATGSVLSVSISRIRKLNKASFTYLYSAYS